jgi:PAT family beta-lactamase induction signal transducer AmpG
MGTWRSLGLAMRSWRTASVSLLSFSSGLPLGLVWIAIPDWMRDLGMDIRIVGLFTLAQAPWTLKFVWSPLMDRYALPWWGRRRGWAAVAQVALFVLTLLLSGLGDHPDGPWVALALTLAIAFAAASQDIAIDAYAVDVLRREEQGIAVGARTAIYRAAMAASGGVAIYLASRLGWGVVNLLLALVYLPLLLVTWKAPEPETRAEPPRTLREAVWLPFLGCLSRHRAIEILAFVVLYKLADNLSQSLLRPFLNDMGYGEFDRGLILGTFGVVVTIAGTFAGGVATTAIGLGNALWVFGLLQIFSNVGYVLITYDPGSRPLMYGAMGFEMLTTGLGTGAFGVLLLRMTQKRFSATQYALFSSLFGLPRIVAGPITGLIVDAAGWRAFFWVTMAAGIPGLLMLQRFAPVGLREPEFTVEAPGARRPLSVAGLWVRGAGGGVVGLVSCLGALAILRALKNARSGADTGFDLPGALAELVAPARAADWVTIATVPIVALACALFTAAVFAARHGATPAEADDE